MSLFRSQLLSKLLSQPADFTPERNVVDFGRTWITRSGLQLLPVDYIARRILENLARHPDFRRIGHSGVGGASHVFE